MTRSNVVAMAFLPPPRPVVLNHDDARSGSRPCSSLYRQTSHLARGHKRTNIRAPGSASRTVVLPASPRKKFVFDILYAHGGRTPSPRRKDCMTLPHPIVFLVDVDNTLVDNDGIQQDLKDHLERTYGRAARERYWRILEDLMVELGYRDYIGALQRFRVEHPREIELLSMSSFLMDYPFADRLYPDALAVLKRLRGVGPAGMLTDGDVGFQPRKVEHAGLARVADGDVLVYIHKEEALDDVERRFPAEHYVLVDDN